MTRFSNDDLENWVAQSPHNAIALDPCAHVPCRYPPSGVQRDPVEVAVTDVATRDRRADHPGCHTRTRCLERCWQTGDHPNERCLVACWQTQIDQ